MRLEVLSPSQSRLGYLGSFWFGVTLPYQALVLVKREKGLLMLSGIPLLIAFALGFWVFEAAKGAVHGVLLQALGSLSADLSSGWVSLVLFFSSLMLLIVGAFLFSILFSLVAAPFNDLLAEKTESKAQPPLALVEAVAFRKRLRIVLIDVMKTLAVALVWFFSFLLSWIPGLNLIILLLNVLLLTFEFVSYPQTRRGQGLLEGLAFVFRYPFSSLGFGVALMVLFSVPGISILTMPLAVIGGTLLFARASARGEWSRLS